MSIRSRYRASLKDRRAEELLDLWIYRPIAFLVASLLSRTDATPNQVTLAAIVAAGAGGVCLARGDREGFALGAALYVISNILDCADGMLARIKRNGTQLGRMIDVFADSVSGAFVYVGLGVGLVAGHHILPIDAWWLVVPAGVSFAVQAALFDRQRNRFLSNAGAAVSISTELAAVAKARESTRSPLRRALMSVYLVYMRWQRRGAAGPPIDERLLRRWSLIGSTTHVTIAAITLALGAPMALFAYVIVAANLWMVVLLINGRARSIAYRASGTRATSSVAGETIAVILAAGTGTRLRPLTNDVPKPLVEVGGRALLARSIDALRAAGVTRFVVVAGYRAVSVERFLDREFPDLDVELLYNHRYAEANNAASVLLAARSLEGARLLLLDGDLLYDPAIVEELVACREPGSRLVVRRSEALGEEEIKVMSDSRGRIVSIGKQLEPSRCIGESIGIAHFDRTATARLFDTLAARMRLPGGAGEFYEASFQQMIDEGCDVEIFDARGRYCIEIDTLEDLADAKSGAGQYLGGSRRERSTVAPCGG